jgi:hypothetical protein
MAQADPAYNEDVFEEGDVEAPKNIHHIRANSSIMQVNKLLGTLHTRRGPSRCSRHLLSPLELPHPRAM